MAPVVFALADAGVSHRLIATGQHESLFDQAVADFGLTVHDHLGAGASGGDIESQIERICTSLHALFATARPRLLLVQGDTTSAYAAAVAADRAGVPVGHVEAGLRSGDLSQPWPEEGNRIAIDAIAALLFAPTDAAAGNLAREGQPGLVQVTGNTGIDALLWMRARIGRPRKSHPTSILITCHRRENHGAGFASIANAILRLAERNECEIIMPLHPNPAVQEDARRRLGSHPNIRLLPPQSYREMVALLASARLLLTDSGGLQEEAPAFGLPTLVLRNVTERPEALATGNLKLVGTDADAIVSAAESLLSDPGAYEAMSRPAFPYGDGRASSRIVAAVQRFLA